MSSSQHAESPKPTTKPFILSKSLKSSSATTSRTGPNRGFSQNVKHLSRFGDDIEHGNDDLPQEEELAGFEAGAAIPMHKREAKAPLVIQVSNKNDWRDRVRSRKGHALPQQAGVLQTAEGSAETAMSSTQYGLVFADASKTEVENAPKAVSAEVSSSAEVEVKNTTEKPLTQDEAALQALIRETKDDNTRKSNLVIPASATERSAEPYDETRDFRADVASRPEPASLAAYNAVPVEEFGAALLRGMGWKEGEPVGRNKYGSSTASLKPRVPERRPGFLGIGAKEVPGKAGELEIGAWGKKAMRKAKTVADSLYTPVVMKNKKTGETLTEAEFKRLREAQEQEKEDRQRSQARRHDEGHGRYSRDDDYSGAEERYSSSRRDRYKERDSHKDHDRRRRKEHDRSRHHSPSRRRDRESDRDDGRERKTVESRSSRPSGSSHDNDDEYRYDRHRHDRRRHDDSYRDRKRMRRH
ncbi:hypothetical protein KEM56_000728 [Ascosphaera pollenicola]|nr:hypothetical protein KEM56_000728 [Ascosphaera pollenicola]